MKRRNTGFTLIELLVVVALIAVLASLAFAMASRARESAWQAACASNLKQIGVAVTSYAGDHDGRMPNLSWDQQYRQIELLGPYVGNQSQLFLCPASTKRKDLWPAWYTYACQPATTGTEACTTYKLNDNQDAVAGHPIASVALPAWLVVAMDTDWADRPRHRNTDNVIFLDGHVQAMTRAELMGTDPNGRAPWWWWGTRP